MAGDCFRKYGDTTRSLPITDTAYWTFATADTVIPWPLTSLNESFQTCADSSIGLFRPYSVLGFKTWRCNNVGHGDTSCASMSGGTSDGISDSNEDWLISSKSFDFSAMTKPELRFWHKLRYTGTVTRSIRISHDYQAGTHPNTASWTTLQVQDMTEEPNESWMPISDIDLSPYKQAPFFLAFTYSCGENGAYELSYDDIEVAEEQLHIQNPNATAFSLKAIGDNRDGQIRLSISSNAYRKLNLRLIDLSGKLCYEGKCTIQPGQDEYLISAGSLAPGQYFLQAYDSQNAGIIKVLLR
ncbi:MAG: hypothetical protein EOP50_17760 [Sphingobacteriales bacterium]|nr:MAG: hypothetical protein EOP50_17760 [Sphingobacteriales bacterium]